MPRYFFNLRRGPEADELTPDPEGDELADEAMVRPHALRIARDMARTRSHGIRDWLTCAFEVTDDAGRHVATVPFSDLVIETPRDQPG